MPAPVTNFSESWAAQCALADTLIGEAIRLRYRLRGSVSAPLPEVETDDLINALAMFVRAAERVPR